MDINILLLIAALVIGFVIGLLLARGQASETISELESRVRTAQTAAENAKLDFTNAQSELIVKDSHINTLNANIGILEEKLRLAEQGREEFTATITRLQDELRAAATDRPAFEVKLRQCHADLDELRAQLAKALAEADELRARIAAEEAEREITALRAQFAAETTQEDAAGFEAAPTTLPEFETEVIADEAEVQGELIAPAEPAAVAEVTPAAGATPQIAAAELEARTAALQNEILSLRDGLATLAFAGAELVAMYEKRIKEYEDRLTHLQAQPSQILPQTIEQQGITPAQTMGLAAGGAAPAEATLALESQLDALKAELNAVFTDKAELETQLQGRTTELEELQKKYDALCADFDTEIAKKAELTAQIDAQTAELGDLRARLSTIEADLDAWLRTQLEAPESEIPSDLKSKLALFKSSAYALKQARASAEARLQESNAQLASLNEQLAKLQTDLEADAQARAELEARLHYKQAEFAELSEQLAKAQGELDAAKQAKDLLEAQLAATKDALQARQVEFDKLQEQLTAVSAERDALKSAVEAQSTTSAAEISADERLRLIREHVKRVKEAAMRAAVESGGEVRSSECPQDLAMAKGIGAVFERRLYAAGIGTFWELANLTGDDLKHILELDDLQSLRIDLDKIRADAQRLAIETNSVGRVWQGAEADDFELLEGIGSAYERKLYEAGICTYEALANTPIERLMEICPPTKLRKPDYAGWIAQARNLAQKKQQGQ